MDAVDLYIQDALDLVDFANGSVTTEWGAKRAALGHPEPFNLKMMGVGNEQWGPQYTERYEKSSQSLKQKDAGIVLIAAAGPDPGDDRFKFLWSKLRYSQPAWFLANTHRYNAYDRNGPKVYMGEYAAQSVATPARRTAIILKPPLPRQPTSLVWSVTPT
jgi:alpha-L-arabinofuranosidase